MDEAGMWTLVRAALAGLGPTSAAFPSSQDGSELGAEVHRLNEEVADLREVLEDLRAIAADLVGWRVIGAPAKDGG